MRQVSDAHPNAAEYNQNGYVAAPMSHTGTSMLALHSAWPYLVTDLSFQFGTLSASADPVDHAPVITQDGEWVCVEGSSSVGEFYVYLPLDAAEILLQAANEDLNTSSLNQADAALVLEHVFTHTMHQLENVLGADLKLDQFSTPAFPLPTELLGFEFQINGQVFEGALHVRGKLHEWFEYVVAQRANPDEKKLEARMIVHLGPVVLPSAGAYMARAGETIDCGVEPSAVIHGVLLRADKYYWPIYIEDNTVEIAGPLTGPVQFPENADDYVYVTFGLGEVSLTAFVRSQLDVGSRIEIERIPNNGAHVYYQTKPFAQGHLSILGQNLAVQLDEIGSFKP